MEFATFRTQLQNNFKKLQKATNKFFETDQPKNHLFQVYLDAIPEDVRQEYNCTNCRRFFNRYGNLVAIIGGKKHTLFDFVSTGVFEGVSEKLAAAVLSAKIIAPHLVAQQDCGVDFNHGQTSDGKVIKWHHLFISFPYNMVHQGTRDNALSATKSRLIGAAKVFERGLTEFSSDNITTVLDLIKENQLYRGKEYEHLVKTFKKHFDTYHKLKSDEEKELYVWDNYADGGRIRNTAIGTLLIDLSDNVDLEVAVKAYDAVMAPSNYNRTTKLISTAQINKAKEEIESLGYMPSLDRQFATASDIPLNQCHYIYREKKKKKDAFTALAEDAGKQKSQSYNVLVKKAKEISLDDFLTSVVPKASSIELLLQNEHNFVTFFSAKDKDAKNMFYWPSDVSWAYANNMTDAITEKVKNAGGQIQGALRVSLEWFNYDDLDLHCKTPDGSHLYFGHKIAQGGMLDVDMNAMGSHSRTPVENIVFNKLFAGKYQFWVNNFRKREHIDEGFNLQIAVGKNPPTTHNFPKAVRNSEDVGKFTVTVSKTGELKFEGIDISEDNLGSIDKAGLATNQFHKVLILMDSPNHWNFDDYQKRGNKHFFAILQNAKLEGEFRPFFTEYLNKEMSTHHRVLEKLAANLQVDATDENYSNQLTGVGVSETQIGKINLLFKVDNVFYNVV